MKRILILLLVLARQAFSGEFTGGDKIDLGVFKGAIPTADKGEFTGGDKPKTPDSTITKEDEIK
jgi:hypothetical protein